MRKSLPWRRDFSAFPLFLDTIYSCNLNDIAWLFDSSTQIKFEPMSTVTNLLRGPYLSNPRTERKDRPSTIIPRTLPSTYTMSMVLRLATSMLSESEKT